MIFKFFCIYNIMNRRKISKKISKKKTSKKQNRRKTSKKISKKKTSKKISKKKTSKKQNRRKRSKNPYIPPDDDESWKIMSDELKRTGYSDDLVEFMLSSDEYMKKRGYEIKKTSKKNKKKSIKKPSKKRK